MLFAASLEVFLCYFVCSLDFQKTRSEAGVFGCWHRAHSDLICARAHPGFSVKLPIFLKSYGEIFCFFPPQGAKHEVVSKCSNFVRSKVD